MTRLRRFLRDTGGAAAIELALVAMPLILLTIGTVELARALFMQQSLSHAASVAARQLHIAPTTSAAALKTTALAQMTLADPAQLAVTLGLPVAVTGTAIKTRDLTLSYNFVSVLPNLLTDRISMQVVRVVVLDR